MAKAKDTNVPAIVESAGTPMTEADIKAMLAQRANDGPTGFENDDASDRVLPFYTILQGLSPQMKTVDGAKLGSVINTATDDMFPNGINIVVVRKDYKYVEWKPNQGGFVAAHDPDSEIVTKCLDAVGGDQFAKLKTPAGNDLIQTKYITGVICDADLKPVGWGTIGFKSTSLKKYKKWNESATSKCGQWQTKLWELVWHFGVSTERNDKGEFYNWNTSLFGGNLQSAFVQPGSALDADVKKLMKEAVRIDHAEGGSKGEPEGGAAGNANSAM